MSKNNKKFREITPDHLRCAYGQCPSIFRSDNGNLVVIGKKLSEADLIEFKEKIGSDEQAILISEEYFNDNLK